MGRVIRALKTPVTLITLLALVVIGGLWGYRNATAAIPPRAADDCVMTDVGGQLAPQHVTVRTLNAGLRGGLAKRVSTNLRSQGFFILKVNNSDERLAQTLVIGAAKDSPEVLLVAGFFKDAKTQGDDRADHVVDVLLGDDYRGFLADAPKSVAVKGPVCLPAITTTSSSPVAAPPPTPKPTKPTKPKPSSPKPSPTKS